MTPTGRLVVCATPIGNLGDVTHRVLDALREADIIAAEDTRVTRKLLARYDIHTPLESYHAKNLDTRTQALVSRMSDGQTVALVSDAGTPGISDPGTRLVDACLSQDIPVEVMPGPSAIVTALVASGLPTYAFYFGGFLPRKAGPMRRALAKLTDLDATLVFYESPRRAAATLGVMADSLPGRSAAVARELTKIHEETLRGETGALAEALADRELKGEVVLLLGPPTATVVDVDEVAVAAAVAARVATGASTRDAVRDTADELDLPRNTVYRIAVSNV